MNRLKYYLLLLFTALATVAGWAQAIPLDTATWKVNPAEYDDLMVITAVVYIDSVESLDSNFVGAFVGTECRGVGYTTAIEALDPDRYLITLLVYSDNDVSETIDFWIYSKKAQRVLPVVEKIIFDSGMPLGTLDNPQPLHAVGIQLAFHKDDVLCSTDNHGYAVVEVKGGAAPYDYKWSNGGTTDSIGGLPAGKYFLTVTDNQGFAQVDSIEIINLNVTIQKPILIASPDTIVCGGTDVHLFAYTFETQNPTYTWYNIFNRALDTSSTLFLSTLPPQSLIYCQTDVRNCLSERSSIAIESKPVPNATIRALETTGFIGQELVFEVAEPSAGVQYKWAVDGGGGGVFTGQRLRHVFQDQGVFKVKLSAIGVNGCESSFSVFVYITALEPVDPNKGKIVLGFNVTDVVCPSDPSGSASVLAFNGVPPYTYKWSNGSTSANIRGLIAGTYRVTVTDSDNNSATGVVTVSSQVTTVNPPSYSINGGQPVCEGSNIWVAALSNYNDAEYYWYDAPTGGNLVYKGDQILLFNIQANRLFYVETRLKGGCISTSRTQVLVTVRKLDSEFTTSATVAPRNFPIEFKVVNPELTYKYSWNFGDAALDSTAEVTHAFADAGVYEVSMTVKSPQGCQETAKKFIRITEEDESFRSVLNVTNVNCTSDRTGKITITLFNGTAPYKFRWNTGDTTATLNNLPVGAYSVTITDARGAEIQEQVSITSQNPSIDIPAITINAGNIVCVGSDVIAAALTNVSDAEFRWYDAATGGNLFFNGPSLTLQNLQNSRALFVEAFYNGCTSPGRRQVLIQAESPDTRFTVSATTVNIGVPINFSVNSPALGNTYLWSYGDGSTATTSLNSHTFEVAGVYEVTLTVTNNRGCSQSRSLLINVIPSRDLSATFDITNVQCSEQRNGSVKVNVFNGTAPYTYSWNTGATSNSLNGLGVGKYKVTITDNIGTALVQEVEISSEVSSIVLPQVVANGDTIACPNEFVTLYAFSSQVGSPSYYWFDAAQGGNLLAVSSVYSFYGKDLTTPLYVEARIGECTSQGRQYVSILTDDPNTGFAASATVVVVGDSIKFTPNTINPAFSYQWFFDNGASSTQPTPTVVYTSTGVYDVRLAVTSDKGCTDTELRSDYINVISSTDLAIVLNLTNVSCEGSNNGAISAEVFNGTTPYDFKWSNGANTPVIANLAPGTYSLTFTDGTGTIITRSVQVRVENIKPAKPTIAINGTNPICFKDDIVLLAASGDATATYKWYDAANQLVFTGTNFNINDIAASTTYTLESLVNGCTSDRANVNLTVQIPNAKFIITPGEIIEAGEPAQFTPEVSNYPTYAWSFGNGGTSNQTKPQFVYNIAGEYDVTLTVQDEDGCTNSSTFDNLSVTPQNVLGVFFRTKNLVCNVDTSGSITAVPVDGTAPYSFKWSNGATTASITGIKAGTYTVTLTDSEGKTTSSTATITNTNTNVAAPTVEVNGNAPVCLGSSAFLLGKSNGFPDATFRWYRNPADSTPVATGSLIMVQSVKKDTVLYLEAFQGGCTSPRVPAQIMPQIPAGDFNVTPGRTLTEGDLVQFKLTNNNATYQYFWNFGDGGWSVTPQPFYFYNMEGTYDVSLEITDANGCTNTITKEDYIKVNKMNLRGDDTEVRDSASNNAMRIAGIQVACFPNPFTNNLTAVVRVQSAGNYRFTITDLLGRTHWTNQLYLDENSVQPIELGTYLDGANTGIYLLRIENGKVNTIHKIIKQD